jgi:hypothetical protein
MGFFQMGAEIVGQGRMIGGAGQPGQGLGQLLLGAVDVGQFVDEEFFDSF